jgi:hypothetical protein
MCPLHNSVLANNERITKFLMKKFQYLSKDFTNNGFLKSDIHKKSGNNHSEIEIKAINTKTIDTKINRVMNMKTLIICAQLLQNCDKAHLKSY